MEIVSKAAKPQVAFLASLGMGHIIPLLELAKNLISNHGLKGSFLVISTDAFQAQNKLFQSPTIPSGIKVVNMPPADISSLINKDTPIFTRLCLSVQESLKSLRFGPDKPPSSDL